jgi:hypothetical protein
MWSEGIVKRSHELLTPHPAQYATCRSPTGPGGFAFALVLKARDLVVSAVRHPTLTKLDV